MEIFAAIFSIAIALTIGAMSPGPSFVMVARTALAVSCKDGLAAVMGMGVGGWCDRTAGTILSLLGAKLVFEANTP